MFLLNYITEILENIISYRFFFCFLIPRKISRQVLIIACGIFSMIPMSINLNYPNNTFNWVISILVTIIISFLFTGSPGHKLLICVLAVIFNMILEAVVLFVINGIFDLEYLILEQYDFYCYFGIVLYQLIRYVVTSYLQWRRRDNRGIYNNKLYIWIAMIPLLSIVLLFLFMKEEFRKEEINYLYCYSLVLIFMLINIVIYYIFEKNDELYRERLIDNYTIQKLKNRETYYKNLELHQEEIRILKHNLKNQMAAIEGYLEQDDVSQARQALDCLQNRIVKREKIYYTRNVAVNSVLNAKESELISKEIEYEFEVKLPERIKMNESDLISLVGNLLDNAIEACSFVRKKKYIRFLLCYYGNTIVILCENSTASKVISLKTKKADSLYHGLGLKSVDHIVDCYSGGKKIISNDRIFRIEINLWDQ